MMKKYIFLFLIFAGLPILSEAQKTKQTKKTVEVEVIKEKDTQKTIIRTNVDGKVKEEIYRGSEADAKVQEIRKTYGAEENRDKRLEVEVKEVNGKKTMTITETVDGKVTVSKYEGEEAERKLKELQVSPPNKTVKKSKDLKKL
jgi:predicted methyltransferase MtxX (methanogen marker protein 4)